MTEAAPKNPGTLINFNCLDMTFTFDSSSKPLRRKEHHDGFDTFPGRN